MFKNYDVKHDERSEMLEYMDAYTAYKAAEARMKKAKPRAIAIVERFNKQANGAEKTDRLFVTIRANNTIRAIIYSVTRAKGAIDWQAYALSLGGTEEGAEQYRKADTVRESLTWATDKQIQELGL